MENKLDIEKIDELVQEHLNHTRQRWHLEIVVYRTIDAIIYRQIEHLHTRPEKLGDRRYVHTFSPNFTIRVGDESYVVAKIYRLDGQHIEESINGRKTVEAYNHYWLSTSDGHRVDIQNMTTDALSALEEALDSYRAAIER